MSSKTIRWIWRVFPTFLMIVLFNASGYTQERDGATLYSQHCARCHSERFATERTDAQWKTILLHMQNRAPLPPGDAQAILEYLQNSN